MWCLSSISSSLFLSTPSARRATRHSKDKSNITVYFYPRPPRGGRHQAAGNNGSARPDFYPRPPRGGRLLAQQTSQHLTKISIHALREEGDGGRGLVDLRLFDFYPRPPRGGRPPTGGSSDTRDDFYPRPPRGGRRVDRERTDGRENFYPRPPRGGRHNLVARLALRYGISIHALREEGDVIDGNNAVSYEISIHALREEGDGSLMVTMPFLMRFLSTPSARRATVTDDYISSAAHISIHALREEGDAGRASTA